MRYKENIFCKVFVLFQLISQTQKMLKAGKNYCVTETFRLVAIEKGKVYRIISAANIDGCIEEGFTINTNIAIHSMLNNF